MPTFSSFISSIPDPLWIIVGIFVTKSADGINDLRKDRIADADNKSDNLTEERRLEFDIEKWKKQVSDDLLRDTQAALDRYKEDVVKQNEACRIEIERINKKHAEEIKVLTDKMEAMRKAYVAELDERDRIILELRSGVDYKPATL